MLYNHGIPCLVKSLIAHLDTGLFPDLIPEWCGIDSSRLIFKENIGDHIDGVLQQIGREIPIHKIVEA